MTEEKKEVVKVKTEVTLTFFLEYEIDKAEFIDEFSLDDDTDEEGIRDVEHDNIQDDPIEWLGDKLSEPDRCEVKVEPT